MKFLSVVILLTVMAVAKSTVETVDHGAKHGKQAHTVEGHHNVHFDHEAILGRKPKQQWIKAYMKNTLIIWIHMLYLNQGWASFSILQNWATFGKTKLKFWTVLKNNKFVSSNRLTHFIQDTDTLVVLLNWKQAGVKIMSHICEPWSWLQPVCLRH